MTARRRRIPALGLPLLLLFFLLPVSPPAPAQEPTPAVSACMSSFCYTTGDPVYLDVSIDSLPASREASIKLELRIYPRAVTRSYLASFREQGKHYPLTQITLDTIPPEGGWDGERYAIDLETLGLPGGVYPFEVRAIQAGEVLSSDRNYLVIMDSDFGYPLNLSLLWTLDFLPSSDAKGDPLDGGLAAACSASASEAGFLYSLTQVQKNTPEVPSSMAIPCATYQNLESLAAAAANPSGGEADVGASEVLSALQDLIGKRIVDLISTTYAFADPDHVASQNWEPYAAAGEKAEDDAARQVRLGVEWAREMGATVTGFVAPLFQLRNGTVQTLRDNGLTFTVVSEDAVRASAAGRKLLEGMTLSQPVNFVSSEGLLMKAFVRDEILYGYLEEAPSRDPSHTVQGIIAELAVLQRERPYAVRSCVLSFPSSFMPNREFLEILYGSVKGCAWLKARGLSDLNKDQFPVEGVAVQVPAYEPSFTDYDRSLSAARGEVLAFSRAIPADHPLQGRLANSILVAENYRFMEEKDGTAARSYLDSIRSVIEGELSKVRVEEKRSVTLSSTQGKLNVDVTSGLDYSLQATLRLENASIIFPESEGNSRLVTIEPRENRFVFSITTRRKGSFIVDIYLEANGLAIDSTSTTVNTSIINSLAIVSLACLTGMVLLAVLFRRLSRKLHEGRHSKGRKKE